MLFDELSDDEPDDESDEESDDESDDELRDFDELGLDDADDFDDGEDVDEPLDDTPTRGAVGEEPPTRIGPAGGSRLGSTFSVSAVGLSPTCSGNGVRCTPVGGMPYFCSAYDMTCWKTGPAVAPP